ncbi:hypothetical protein N2152v2_001050 [Parachlorella kessleri]
MGQLALVRIGGPSAQQQQQQQGEVADGAVMVSSDDSDVEVVEQSLTVGLPQQQQQQQNDLSHQEASRVSLLGITPADEALPFVMDVCGCCVSRDLLAEAVQAMAADMPSGLADLLRHFTCPQLLGCGGPLSHRDLVAVLGPQQARQVDERFYRCVRCVSAALARRRSLGGLPPPAASGAAVAAAALGDAAADRTLSGSKRKSSEAKGSVDVIDLCETGPSSATAAFRRLETRREGRTAAAAAVGIAANARGAGRAAQLQRVQEAEQRQQEVDKEVTDVLCKLKALLQRQAEQAGTRGLLPLWLLCMLHGGTLMPCLRLLLCNDCLFDITARRQLYNSVLQLITHMAGSMDLVPLLLQPADMEIMQQQRQEQQQEQKGTEQGSGATAGQQQQQSRQPADAGRSSESSVCKALEALRVQCDVFRRGAEQLAGQGSEEDMLTVSTVMDVLECCDRTAEAVALFQSASFGAQRKPTKDAEQPGSSGAGAARRGRARRNTNTDETDESRAKELAALKARYREVLKPLQFQTTPLLARHYFKNQAKGAEGAVTDRLRRITREISTLPGQLPLEWESSIFVAMDEDRMDVLSAMIIAPPDTPYAHGCFLFDILLPPDYPSRPPLVQFLTTGGGRVRFNPNLYEVLISIQSMILGTAHPYFNEPGFSSSEGTKQGDLASAGYNQKQRYNTLTYCILPALQTPPEPFAEVVRVHYRLKAEVVREQCRQWASEAKSQARAGQGQRAVGVKGAMPWPDFTGGAAMGSVEQAAANVEAALDRVLANGER